MSSYFSLPIKNDKNFDANEFLELPLSIHNIILSVY